MLLIFFAAKLSAVIPFVSGPALVSFLAVMINPVTVIAGTAALGYWAINGLSTTARTVATARVAVLLAISGMQDNDGGIAALATSFRRSHRLSKEDHCYLDQQQYDSLVERAQRIECRLKGDIPPAKLEAPGIWGRPLHSGLSQDVTDIALTGGLTAGDLLYHAAAIDPAVLAAVNFSRNLAVESPIDLAVHISAFASNGAQIALRGYTAEQLLMARLVDKGHVVELAADSTMPGYDLIVDGTEVQVKCGASLSLLHEHFSKYPDIPVIADVALAKLAYAAGAPWAHLVTTVEGFDLNYVQDILDRSLDAAQSLGESVLPIYATIVGGVRATGKVWKGEIAVEDLPAWLVVDLSIRGGLGAAGQVGGAFVGLLVVGPAGALVLGPVVGIAALFGTRQLHGLFDRTIRSQWHTDVITAAEDLRVSLKRACERQLDMLLMRQQRLKQEGENVPGDLMRWLDSRMIDDALAAWEAVEGLKVVSSLPDAMELMIQTSTVTVADPQTLAARRELEVIMTAKPSTMGSIAKAGEGFSALVQDRGWWRK